MPRRAGISGGPATKHGKPVALPSQRRPRHEGSQLGSGQPIGRSDGSPAFSVRVFSIEPGGHTPYHQHPSEHLNYVIEGHGALVTASGDERDVKQGDFALVLPDEMHQYRNKSKDQPLVMICAVPKEYE
jgi:quercetin dioxygenase-like cupin family protein